MSHYYLVVNTLAHIRFKERRVGEAKRNPPFVQDGGFQIFYFFGNLL